MSQKSLFEKIQTELPFKAEKVTFWAKLVKFRNSHFQTCKIPQGSVYFRQNKATRNAYFCHPSNGIWYLFDAIFTTSRGRMMENIHICCRFLILLRALFVIFAESQKTHWNGVEIAAPFDRYSLHSQFSPHTRNTHKTCCFQWFWSVISTFCMPKP